MSDDKVILQQPDANKAPSLLPAQIEQMQQQAYLDEIIKVGLKHGYALVPSIVSVPLGESAPGVYVQKAQINIVKQQRQ